MAEKVGSCAACGKSNVPLVKLKDASGVNLVCAPCKARFDRAADTVSGKYGRKS